jgi:hypothetical protein
LLSRTFYDEEAEMYANPVDFLEATFPDYEERPEEEVIDYLVKAISERQPITDYNVFQINDDLDTVTAERVGFGVLQMLTGKYKGQCFAYKTGIDSFVQLVIYRLFVFGEISEKHLHLLLNMEYPDEIGLWLGRKTQVILESMIDGILNQIESEKDVLKA